MDKSSRAGGERRRWSEVLTRVGRRAKADNVLVEEGVGAGGLRSWR